MNDKVIEQERDSLAAMTCVKFVSDRSAHLLPADALTFPLHTTRIATPFCHDIAQGVREGHTVTFVALQIAHYMGAAEVVIIGMDHRFHQTGAPGTELRMEGPDPNHFCQTYFADKTWDAANLAQSEASYAIAREVYESTGRRIVDATVDGSCPVFPKADYRRIFGH